VRTRKVAARVVAERSDPAAVSRELWKGLVRFNRQQAGPLDYKRTVLLRETGYQRFGGISGSPRGESRHFYVKRLRAI
jgi:hypothetical protein